MAYLLDLFYGALLVFEVACAGVVAVVVGLGLGLIWGCCHGRRKVSR